MKHSLVILFLLLIAPPLMAHKLAPSLLRIQEVEANNYQVFWKTPKKTAAKRQLEPTLPGHCSAQNTPEMQTYSTAVSWQWMINCQQPLAHSEIVIDGMAENGTATLVNIEWLDGRHIQQLLNADEPSFIIPERQQWWAIFADYIGLGAEHIWLGIDHLLFVLALVMLVPGNRRLVWTITAFTIGHSITLSLVSLGFLDYPVSLVEFAIAASILVLAIELSRGNLKSHWIPGHSWLVAGSFGLLHGMGFAGALREVGLPAGDIPLALLSFNIGIELGQIAFVVVCLIIIAACLRFAGSLVQPGRWVTIYSIGALSTYWCIERGLGALI